MLIRLTRPTGLPIDLDTVRREVRIDFHDDDARLARLLRSEIQRYEAFTGRILSPQSFEYRTDDFEQPTVLPVVPVREITAVVYLDAADQEQTLAAANWYRAEGATGTELRYIDGFSPPDISERADPVRVRFTAGYDKGAADDADAENTLQERDVTNVLMLIQRIYDQGEQMSDDDMRRFMGARRVLR